MCCRDPGGDRRNLGDVYPSGTAEDYAGNYDPVYRTGALRIELGPAMATLEFRAVSGELLDRSRAAC